MLLVEAGRKILNGNPDNRSDYAKQALEKLGVEVRLNAPVTQIERGVVTFGGRRVAAHTIIWAAGVRASPAAEWLGAPADRNGRILVEPDLSIPGYPDIFAVGDTITVQGPNGAPVPGIAPAAKQEGAFVAETIRRRLAGDPSDARSAIATKAAWRRSARARRRSTSAEAARPLAWWFWGLAHIYFLVGVRSRLSVALNWLWIYTRNQRSARLITQAEDRPTAD